MIFISSESGVSPSPEMPHDAATKTMQLSISRSLAELTKGTAVTVNTVMPGSTLTEGVAKFVQDLFPGLSVDEAGRRFMRENRPTSLIERFAQAGRNRRVRHFPEQPGRFRDQRRRPPRGWSICNQLEN